MTSRRLFLRGALGLLAAPAIVRASSLMSIVPIREMRWGSLDPFLPEFEPEFRLNELNIMRFVVETSADGVSNWSPLNEPAPMPAAGEKITFQIPSDVTFEVPGGKFVRARGVWGAA